MNIRHPAKYTDSFISIFADLLKDRNNVLDPFAGTGKLGLIKQCGFSGTIYANEIEPEWINENLYDCDLITWQDAEFLDYPPNTSMQFAQARLTAIVWQTTTKQKTARSVIHIRIVWGESY
jgi:hypothetical protein